MGALAASTSSGNWLVEDDILLKNAVENGASLEALAKGAVCFSHKFTLQELQDRWSSLLYNPEISAQASARMVEHETELSISNPAKTHKLFNSKARDFSFKKRKTESVKNLYYISRKKPHNEPCDTNGLGFLIAPCPCIAAGRDCVCGGLPSRDQVHNIETGIGTSCYGQADGSYNGAQHMHPEINGHSFHTQHAESMIEDADTTNNAPYGYSDVVQIYDQHAYMQPEIGEGDHVSLRGITDFQDSMQFQQLASSNQCGNEVAEPKTLVITDQGRLENVHFPGNSNGVAEHGALHLIRQSEGSQTPCGAIWNGVEETETLTLADDKKIKTVSRDPLTLQANLDSGISMPCLDHAAMPDGDFMDFPFFSNSDEFDLLNGENFLNSPHETNQEDLDDPDTKVVLGASSVVQNPLHPDEAIISCDQVDTGHLQHNLGDVSGMILVPTSAEVSYPGSQYVECILNTEDPDIPCNDDIVTHGEFSPRRPTASPGQNSEHKVFPSPPATSPPSKAEHSNASDLAQLMREDMSNAKPSLQPMRLSPSTLEQKEGSVALNKGLGAKPSVGPSTSSVVMQGNIDTNDASTCMLALPAIHPSGFVEGPSCSLGQHDFDNSQSLKLYNPVQVSDHMNYHSHGNQPELRDVAAVQNCMPSHAPSDLGLQDPMAVVPTTAQAEECSDIENDVPNYYDIEALILEQDLIPWDQDSDLKHPEVSRFQHPESRRSLIRLEQGARSCLNRAIMSRGAFAVIYGLHLKYYIKDPEVTIGRETEDVKVDIDLGKEGKANKISRRQAVIKMDEAGSFHIKNIGKGSIFVNSKEVPCCKGINLSSDSLIEIKDMRLIFHANQDAVRQYVSRIPRL
ncbi:uncharacterized protein LOC100838325 [Brachypodium distachyon]|uniref:FHA domain-containing protein n=1 Tax=Brachypodium distachyon TaxID=15368 RepID=I1GM34_BRADI|nr:uncharacterized protein LOC100838325 [Brachypodium distachyon]KQK12651.2 hypothetical protein BRADI_1g05130v3 [Brachypodium distachyon]|eukprot:XP_024310441.1 uncharacterized protein LOC100838325 [Brachypodium distachyon]